MPDEVNKLREQFNRDHAGCTPPAELRDIHNPEHLIAVSMACLGCGERFQGEFVAGFLAWPRPDVGDEARN